MTTNRNGSRTLTVQRYHAAPGGDYLHLTHRFRVSGHYAGHSLRADFATAAAAGGASERAIMRQTGHPSLPMLRRYICQGLLFTDNAVASTGL